MIYEKKMIHKKWSLEVTINMRACAECTVWLCAMKENEMMKLYGDKVSGGSGNAMTKRSKIHPVHWRRGVKEICFTF